MVATGDGLAYQWERSNNAGTTWSTLAGATSTTYSIATVDIALDGHQYRVRVSGTANTVTSSAASLSVTPASTPVVITTSPSDTSVVLGSNASFSVTATGTSPSYQWQSSSDGTAWTNIPAATGTTLTLSAVSLIDNGRRVRAVVSNTVNTATSNTATLTVTAPASAPAITTPPQATSVVQPAAARFSVTATGNPVPTYQWQQSTDGGTTYVDIASATSDSYVTPTTTLADSGKLLRVRVSNSAGVRLSAAAALTVTSAPVVPAMSLQPINEATRAPTPVTYRATATGSPTPTYQWQLSIDNGASFANINGATSPDYTTPATLETDTGRRYRVVASNSAGSVTSTSVRLSVGSAGLNGAPRDIVVDSDGNLIVGTGGASGSQVQEWNFSGIYRISPAGVITVLAGAHGGGFVDGTGGAARFSGISAITLDRDGNIYVADAGNHAIRKITPQGVVTTLAGGSRGFEDGQGTAAKFFGPAGVAVDASGNVFVSDTENHAIRRITPGGLVSTFAGGMAGGSVDGQGTAARIYYPRGLSFDPSGNLIVADTGSHWIRSITPQGYVSTIISSGISFLRFLRVDAAGDLYLSITGVKLLRVYQSAAGRPALIGFDATSGPVDGVAGGARFGSAGGVGIDSSGNAYVADGWGMSSPVAAKSSVYMIRKVTPAGVVTTMTLTN